MVLLNGVQLQIITETLSVFCLYLRVLLHGFQKKTEIAIPSIMKQTGHIVWFEWVSLDMKHRLKTMWHNDMLLLTSIVFSTDCSLGCRFRSLRLALALEYGLDREQILKTWDSILEVLNILQLLYGILMRGQSAEVRSPLLPFSLP